MKPNAEPFSDPKEIVSPPSDPYPGNAALTIEGDKVIFSTGRSFYANEGIIGICPTLRISEGYDGGLSAWPGEGWEKAPALTAAERRELADYMIGLWTEFREADKPKE
jgi:hypothetical protein